MVNMEAKARAPQPDLRIETEGLDETAPLLGRRPILQTLDTQVHPPAIDEVAPLLAMPATRQLAADYEVPHSAASYDAPMRHWNDGPEKGQDDLSIPTVQILILCYCRMIEPVMV